MEARACEILSAKSDVELEITFLEMLSEVHFLPDRLSVQGNICACLCQVSLFNDVCDVTGEVNECNFSLKKQVIRGPYYSCSASLIPGVDQ